MCSPNSIKKQFSQGLFSRIEKLTCAFASPKTHIGSKRARDNLAIPGRGAKPSTKAVAATMLVADPVQGRSRTPQPGYSSLQRQKRCVSRPGPAPVSGESTNKVNLKELNNRLYYEYLKFQRDKDPSVICCSRPASAAQRPTMESTLRPGASQLHHSELLYSSSSNNNTSTNKLTLNLHAMHADKPGTKARTGTVSVCGPPEEDENWNPNGETAKCKNLLLLLNKEREAVSSLKAELKRVCVESREEKGKLQQEIDELNKTNTAYYKQYMKEKENSAQLDNNTKKLAAKSDSVSAQVRVLVSGVIEVIEKLLLLRITLPNTEDPAGTGKKRDSIDEIRELITQKLQKASATEGGVDLSDELGKLTMLQERVAQFVKQSEEGERTVTKKLQTWATTTGLEQIEEEDPAETAHDPKAVQSATQAFGKCVHKAAQKDKPVPKQKPEPTSKPLAVQVEKKDQKRILAMAGGNMHRGSEIFGPILSAIEASGIAENNDTADHPSLMGTIENLNVELGNLSLSEDVALSPDNPRPRLDEGPSKAMKELEELKNKIRSRRSKTAGE